MAAATARTYELRLERQLGPAITALFPEFSVAHCDDGTTILQGSLPDQAALHGTLARVRDLNLVLVGLRRIECTTASAASTRAPADAADRGTEPA